MATIISHVLSLPPILAYSIVFIVSFIIVFLLSLVIFRKTVLNKTPTKISGLLKQIATIIGVEFLLLIVLSFSSAFLTGDENEIASAVLVMLFSLNLLASAILVAIGFSILILVRSHRHLKSKILPQ